MPRDGNNAAAKKIEIPDNFDPSCIINYRHGRGLKITCFAKDEQHAIKIANERRVYLISRNSI